MTQEDSYTFEQAADKIGVRADDLPALLPNIGVDPNDPARKGDTLSGDEVARLAQLKSGIEQIHKEGTDNAVDD